MSGLSPELREFVRASRSAIRPTETDSARIIAGLRARLGDAALVGTETAQAAATSTATNVLFGKMSLMSLAGLAVLGGIWFFAARSPRAAAREANAATSVATTAWVPAALTPGAVSSSTPTLPEAQASAVAAAASSTPDGDKARPAASHHSRDRLAQEVAIISRAEAALRNGRPALALEVLNEHEREFGNGLLAEERIAARAQALCALGRTAEADAQLKQLSPNSLHGQRSQRPCSSQKNN